MNRSLAFALVAVSSTSAFAAGYKNVPGTMTPATANLSVRVKGQGNITAAIPVDKLNFLLSRIAVAPGAKIQPVAKGQLDIAGFDTAPYRSTATPYQPAALNLMHIAADGKETPVHVKFKSTVNIGGKDAADMLKATMDYKPELSALLPGHVK